MAFISLRFRYITLKIGRLKTSELIFTFGKSGFSRFLAKWFNLPKFQHTSGNRNNPCLQSIYQKMCDINSGLAKIVTFSLSGIQFTSGFQYLPDLSRMPKNYAFHDRAQPSIRPLNDGIPCFTSVDLNSMYMKSGLRAWMVEVSKILEVTTFCFIITICHI